MTASEERPREHQQTWLSAALGDDPDVAIETDVRMGTSAEQLLASAEGADLLVVGSRGRGGFRGLLLGSVSQQCAILAVRSSLSTDRFVGLFVPPAPD